MKDNIFSNIPEELKTKELFCLHVNKIPKKKISNKLYNVKINEEKDFKSYDEIIKDYTSSNASGISIKIHSSLCGIDIDNCYSEKGELSEIAIDILKTIKSYTEQSLSGKGIHILFKCNNQKKLDSMLYYTNRHFKSGSTGGLEIYQGQFDTKVFTISGKPIYNEQIKEIDFETLQIIFDKYMKHETKEQNNSSVNIESTPEEDKDFIEKGLQFNQAFNDLYNGIRPSSDESSNDFKLLSYLAYYSNKNEVLMKDYFERSQFYNSKDDYHQKKWNRKDYQSQTIQRAINQTTTTAKDKQEKFKQSKGNENQMKEKIKDFISNNNVLNQTNIFFDTIKKGTFKPYSVGFEQLDKALNGGITNQSIFVLNGGTSTGKTTFILNLCLNLIKTRPVLYYTLEMSKEQIYSKVFSNLAYTGGGMSISSTSILQSYDENKMTSYQKGKLIEELNKHDELSNLFVIYPEETTIEFITKDLEDKLNYYKEEGLESPLIIIDYLQFIRSNQKEDSQSLIKKIQRNFKKLSIDYETTFFLLSATSRDKTGGKSSIDSGRDSSDIEFSSDYLLSLNFYSWEHSTNKELPSRDELVKQIPRKMTITIHKNRFGEIGKMIDYNFNGITNVFEEIKPEEIKIHKVI